MPKIILTSIANAEEILAREVHEISAISLSEIKLKSGHVSFDGSIEDAYKLCLHSRLANRVLWVLCEGKANTAEELYQTAQSVDWPSIFASSSSFSIHAKGTNRALKNTQFIAQKVKDAIVDNFIEQDEKRPQVDKESPDIVLQVRLHRDQMQLCLDMSYKSLHMRGYRQSQGEAPLKENVAALLLYRSGWTNDMSLPLFDPMCGSGTLLIEAAMMAKKIAPNLHRTRWGFDYYLGHKVRAWQAIKAQAEEAVIESPEISISGCDIDHKMLEIAKTNIKNAKVSDVVKIKQGNALQQFPATECGLLISNPPYGERLKSYLELLPLYHQWGKHLKSHYPHWKLALICSENALLSCLKLRAEKKYSLKNGALDCQFHLYALEGDNLQDFNSIKDDDEFANRIRKNKKRLKKFLNQASTNAYRLYDADLPNYNFAIDVYAEWLIVQEYKAPKSIPEKIASQRLQHAILCLPELMNVDFSKVVVKTRERQKGQRQYAKLEQRNQTFTVKEAGAKFIINPHDYLDVGLFLDHRITRQLFAQRVRDKHVLNLFAYTGSVSVHSALAGARSVLSVDMSKTYIDWAKRNFAANNLKGNFHFEQADCLRWLSAASQGLKGRFDAIFVDPPSFSNSKRMDETWDVQRDHLTLLSQLKNLLSDDGFIFFSNNLRNFVLDEQSLLMAGFSIENITDKTIPEDFARNSKIHQCWILS